MTPPLCSVAVLYMTGLLLGQWLHVSLAVLFAASFSLGLIAIFYKTRRLYFLAAFLIVIGWTNISWRTALLSPHDLRLLLGTEPVAATVRGVLCASPTPRFYVRDGREVWHSSVAIHVKEIFQEDRWQPAWGKVVAIAPGVLASNFFDGQSVEVAGVLAPPRGPAAEGLFDARTFYRRQTIYYQLHTESTNSWNIAAENRAAALPLSDRFLAWAKKTLALGLPPDDGPLRLIWTLALDWKAPLTAHVEEPFMRAGTYHIFAVDGLRIGLLAAIGVGLLRAAQIPRAWCGMVVIPVIWAYAALTGWPASAIRAAIMMSIVILGWASARPVHLVNSLFAAALIILLWDPEQLFQPGFQLSFLVVFCIGLLFPVLRKYAHKKIFEKDPFLAPSLRPRWPPLLRASTVFAMDVCIVSVAAWVGSVPLAAADFHLFTPVSVLANILVVPITALALMSSIASLLVGAWLPILAVLFNHASWFFMDCIIHLSAWAARLPWASFNVSTPSTVTFLLYYLVVCAVLTGWVFRSRFRSLTLATLAGLCVCWAGQWIVARQTSHLYLLPLHGGAAAFSPDKTLLFDCGNASEADLEVKPFLCAQGVNALQSFCLTVGHQQFGGGAKVVLTNFPVGKVVVGAEPNRSAAYSGMIEDVKKTFSWRSVHAGDMDGGWTVLHPPLSSHFSQADDKALVFWRKMGDRTILLLSSLGRAGQDSLVESHQDLRADIVVAGMPATDEPLGAPLLDLIRPKIIIVLDTEFPATRRATAKLRSRLAEQKVPVFYGRDAGSLTLNFGRLHWSMQNAEGKELFHE